MNDLAELFLTSSSILVGALGVARTEGLKFGVSGLGAITSVLWFSAYSYEGVLTLSPVAILPILFLVAWGISLCIHGPKFRVERRALKALGREFQVLSPLDEIRALPPDEVITVLRTYVDVKTAPK